MPSRSRKPQPTKPIIKPSKKLKAYQWRRLLKEPKDKPKRKHVVWDDIEEVTMELAEVEELFEDKRQVKETSVAKPKKVNVKKSYFDADTSQKMCIVMKRLPKPHVTAELLTKIDHNFTEKISPTVIGGLLRSWPDPNEFQSLIDEYSGHPNEQWDFAEDYVICLKDIKNITTKLEVIRFCLEYSEQKEFFLEPLVKFETAFKNFDECTVIKNSLAIILTLGNILNGGNKTRGQADGFAIEGMSKIVSIKDVNNKSGMEYVCKKLLEIDPEARHFKREIKGIYESKNNSLSELSGMFEGYIGQAGIAKTKCDKIAGDKDDTGKD